ncbi:MAG: sugar ABC transporter substrate-binding protein [Thaumarchaeota archaeon]|jgi:multiple sugar transport system substrate-binding protein|nr:sugar ABC transporter substrate-binding protein [Candidatus Terraquivivens yellowstonensis]
MSETRVSRRDFLKYVGSGIVGFAAGAGIGFGYHAMAPPPTAPPPEVTSKPFKGITLNVQCIQPHVKNFRDVASIFEKYYGAKVVVTDVPYGEHLSRILLDVTGGVGHYDVYEAWYVGISMLVANNCLMDLTDLVERDKEELNIEDFHPTLWKAYALREGKVYGLPVDGDIHTLVYRPSILEKYGFMKNGKPDLPTWDKFSEAVKTITEGEKGKPEAERVYGCSLMLAPIHITAGSTFANRFGAYGGKWFNPDGTPAINSEAGVKTLQNIIDTIPYAIPGTLTYAFDEQRLAFFQGKTAMMEMWPDIYIRARRPEESAVYYDVGVTTLPGGVSGLNAGFSVCVSSLTKKKEAAWAFCKFITSPAMQTLSELGLGGLDPTRISVATNPELMKWEPEYFSAWSDSITHSFPWPTLKQAEALMTILVEEQSLAAAGTKSIESALASIEDRWKSELAKG